MFLKKLFPGNGYPAPLPPTYSALIDTETKVLLTLSSNKSAIIFLGEEMDATHANAVNYPNYEKSFPLASADPEKYPLWTWDPTGRKFVQTKPEFLTKEIVALSSLVTQKRDVFIKITTSLNTARQKIKTGVELQDVVYATKKTQAQEFKRGIYDENSLMEIPYVVQYADYSKISLAQAADDILLKAKLDDEHLAKTELMRLKYFNKIRHATSSGELTTLYEDFLRDFYINAQV